jgi:hypothetical protein
MKYDYSKVPVEQWERLMCTAIPPVLDSCLSFREAVAEIKESACVKTQPEYDKEIADILRRATRPDVHLDSDPIGSQTGVWLKLRKLVNASRNAPKE